MSSRWDRGVLLTLSFLLAVLAGCGRPPAVANPVQRAFWNQLRSLCGRAFPGRLVQAAPADSALVGQPLVLEVWQCYPRELRLAFHVGEDRSRVWVVAASGSGLTLKHQLHARDGSPTEYSGYGGETWNEGTKSRQEFRADEHTVHEVPSAASTLWTLELVPHTRLTYAVRSAGAEQFRVDFDLARAALRPAPPWGYTRAGTSVALPDTARQQRH